MDRTADCLSARVMTVVVVLCALTTATSLHAAPALLFTADTEGHAGPCDACPSGRGLGGLARRAALAAKVRVEGPALLLDGGNALFGNDDSGAGPEGGAALVARAYAKLGYDAVNLSYRDFRAGREATLKLIRQAGLSAVSANVIDEASGQPVVKPYVVIDRGGERVAVVGVTEAPRGIVFLPHLKQQLAGLRIDPPPAALKSWLPNAKAEAARVVVLYYGSAAGLEAVRAEAAAGGAEAILVGGVRPESLPADSKPPLVGAAEHGKYVTRVAPGGGEVEQLAVDSALSPDAAVQEIVASAGRAAVEADAGATEAAVRVELPSLPAQPQADKLYPVHFTTGNHGAKFSISSAGIVKSYGSLPADGGPYLVVSTRWENVIPLTVIRDQKVPTEYQIPNLADHLYIVVDGSRLARLDPKAGEQPGHVPVREFTLPKIGASISGNVVFALPRGGPKSIELRFYDYAHGHFSVPLLKSGDAVADAGKPVSPPQKNEVLEVAAYGFTREKTLSGQAAPDGMTYVTVELRARSTFTVDADASAFDPKARPGQKTKVGHVADWKESRRYLQLVADGEYAYMAEPQTELDEEPRFLPDVMTGDKVVFLAPAQAKSLELRCDFPNARASTGGAVFRPKGTTLPLEGKRPEFPTEKPVASVDDDNYRVQVLRQAQAAEFAGQSAPAGRKFFVLDVTVHNRGVRNGEFFQTTQQLKYAAETGEQLPLSPVTFQGVRRPAELVWIPPSERRSFQAVFEVSANEKRPRLAFTGVSRAEVLKLNPIEAMAAAAPAAAPGAAAKGKPGAARTGGPTEVASNTKAAPAPSRPAAPATTPPRKDVPQLKAPDPKKDVKALRVTAKQPHQPRGLAGVGLTAEQVNAAIDKGAEFLWNHQRKEMKQRGNEFGRMLGYDVLVGLALVHADYHRKNPDFDAELRQMMSRVDPSDLGTYGAGCLAMLIEHYGDGYYLPKLKQTVRCILENQHPDGTWGYSVRLDEKLLRDPSADRVLQIRGGIPLEGTGALGEPMERITPFDTKNNYSGDNSTTQYAMLGLWSAAKVKTPVVPKTWELALGNYRRRQGEDGGWNYSSVSYGYGSMTCAGVASVAIARHQLGEKDPAADEGIERGLAWLANHFSVSKHPDGSGAHLYYYLYSLERVGRILDTEFIGPHEWYPQGARFLVDQQSAEGQWKGAGEEEKPELANSFALLFLTRATSTLNVAQKRGGDGKLRTNVAVAPGSRVYIILDCSGSMLPEIDGKQKFQIARDAVRALVDSLPANSEVALRAYGHRLNARQEGADEDTELLLPMQKLDIKAFQAKLFPLRARGKTPLALSLKQAAADLSGFARDPKNPVTVVLLTDGGEDTRARLDPVAEAAALAKLPGVDLQVVGFDINRPDWTKQLQGIARAGRGQYLTASKADTLVRELKSAVFRTPEQFVVTTPRGQPVMQAPFGTEKVLPEGEYRFTTAYGGRRFSEPFWINTGATTAIVFDASKLGTDESGEDVAETDAGVVPAPESPAGEAPAPAAPAAKRKFCTNCGAPLTVTAKFCTKCGTKAGG